MGARHAGELFLQDDRVGIDWAGFLHVAGAGEGNQRNVEGISHVGQTGVDTNKDVQALQQSRDFFEGKLSATIDYPGRGEVFFQCFGEGLVAGAAEQNNGNFRVCSKNLATNASQQWLAKFLEFVGGADGDTGQTVAC